MLNFRAGNWLMLGVVFLNITVSQAAWRGVTVEAAEILSLNPNLERGTTLYEANCMSCHEMEAWGSIYDGDYPQLAGQHRSVLLKQLMNMRDGKRNNPAMKEVIGTGVLNSQQNLSDLVMYISSLPMTPENGRGKGEAVVLGRTLYKKVCANCHGKNGEGNAAAGMPLLQAQHYGYMLKQFEEIKEGKRSNANPAMVNLIQKFSEEDTAAVLDYVSRLEPPKDKRAGEQSFIGFMDQLKSYSEGRK